MKLLEKLRAQAGGETLAAEWLQPAFEALGMSDPFNRDHLSDLMTEDEDTQDDTAFGVGAAMSQDISGFGFMDSGRRPIPDLHEFPPYGFVAGQSEFYELEG